MLLKAKFLPYNFYIARLMPTKAKFSPRYYDDKLFRALIENISDAIALLDKQGRLLYISPSATRVLGYPPEEVIGQSAFSFIHPQDVNRIRKLLATLVKKPSSRVTAEYRLLHKDGSWRWFEGIATNLLNNPSVNAVVATYHDITERKKGREALIQSEARFKKLVDSNVVGIYLMEDEKITEANDAFLKLLGYSKKDLKEDKIKYWDLTPAEHRAATVSSLREIKEQGTSSPIKKEYFRKNGSRVPVLVGKVLLRSKPLQWIGLVLDQTEQKELEDRKDSFISMTSHELKTPVTTIKVFNQLLQQRFNALGDTSSLTYLLKMDEQITRLTELVEDLLDLSKIEAGQLTLKKEFFYISDLIEETVDYLQEIFPTHQIIIDQSISQKVWADKHRIEQVLINLISNAVKYSPKTDKVSISSGLLSDKLVIKVTDFGIGISAADQKHIFERFYRVYKGEEKTYPGLGMGLYISYLIIRRHGGAIKVESTKNKGSTFMVTLPIKKTLTALKPLVV